MKQVKKSLTKINISFSRKGKWAFPLVSLLVFVISVNGWRRVENIKADNEAFEA